jgi:hypothetical protein
LPAQSEAGKSNRKRTRKAIKKIEEVIPLKGWVSIPSGSIQVAGSNDNDRTKLIIIGSLGSQVFLDHEVTVSEYNSFRVWIATNAPSLSQLSLPSPKLSSLIPQDYYSKKKYRDYPAIGLSPYQIALFCSWVNYSMFKAYQPDQLPGTFTQYLEEDVFWTNFISRSGLAFESFNFALPVNLFMTDITQAYCFQKYDKNFVYNPDNPELQLKEAKQFSDISPVKNATKNEFGLYGAKSNVAEPFAIVAFDGVTLDETNKQTNTGIPVEVKASFVSIKGLTPATDIQLQFLQGDTPPPIYGFRISILYDAYLSAILEKAPTSSDF